MNFDAFDINSVNAARNKLGLKALSKKEYIAWAKRYCQKADIVVSEEKVATVVPVKKPANAKSNKQRFVVVYKSAFTYIDSFNNKQFAVTTPVANSNAITQPIRPSVFGYQLSA